MPLALPKQAWLAEGVGAKVTRSPTRHLKPRQARNMIEAAAFARKIGMLLTTHATIIWNGTGCFDDPDGRRLAGVREGLSKALKRRGISFAAVWVREVRPHRGEHVHVAFHLPSTWCAGNRRDEIVRVVERLVDRHGDGLYGDWAVKLTHHANGDIRYLLKGGTPEVWRDYRIKGKWREPQGVIFGKRCGTTENIGAAARKRRRDQQGVLLRSY